jgi:hypothetical protein
MIVAALIDAGADAGRVRQALDGLHLSGYALSIQKVAKHGLAATSFRVDLDTAGAQPHRHLHHVTRIIDDANLHDRVKDRAKRIFTRLAEAEAEVHGTTIEKVHFHEVGAIDAIVDIVGAVLALDLLTVDRILCAPMPTGSGTITCEHGVLPVPAPATAKLLRGFPIAESPEPGELVTPTGAAILTTLATEFGPLPAMRLASVGYGAGIREGRTRPNLLRVLIGETDANANADSITVLETNLDDVTPQVIGHTIQRLLDAGALDAYTLPIQMKKQRPGVLLTVLCSHGDAPVMESILFSETATLGIRRHTVTRALVPRSAGTVETSFGTIRMKIADRDGGPTATPEYEDCRAAAQRWQTPLREVIAAAQSAWRNRTAEPDAPGRP